MAPLNFAFLQELRNHLIPCRTVVPQLTPAKAVPGVIEQRVQLCNLIASRHIGRNVVRICDADIRCCVCGYVRNDVVVDLRVIRIQLQRHRDVRIQRFEILDGLLIHRRLVLVGVVLGPEGNLVLLRLVKALRHRKGRLPLRAVASRQGRCRKNPRQ